MDGRYWALDDFERHIDAAIICLSEDNYLPKKKINRGLIVDCPRNRLFQDVDFAKLKNTGVYFGPGDRVFDADAIWMEIDTLPEASAYSFGPEHAIDMRSLPQNSQSGESPYLEIIFSRKINNFPKGVISFCPTIAKYKLSLVYGKEKGGVHGWSYYFGIDKDGLISPCDSGVKRQDLDIIKMYAATTLGMECDRKYLWNVSTVCDGAKVTLGVYESQIKSLLYARELPMTETGRKRPILHWVESHRRRLKTGVNVDVQKFLRGTSEFEMFGEKFFISNPVK